MWCLRRDGGLYELPITQFKMTDGGVRGNAFQIAQLIDAHAQRDADFGIADNGQQPDQVIELRLIAQASEDDFRSQGRVARLEPDGSFEQEVGCEAAFVNFAKNVERDLARGGQQILF